MRNVTILILTAFSMLAVAPVYADDAGEAVARAGVHAVFDELQRQIIKKYFKEHVYEPVVYEDAGYQTKKQPKKKDLPPGIQKKLARGGTLPPGIAKQYLPDGLVKQLPPLPQGYERRIVDNDVLLVSIDTGEIADIITDAILGD